MDNNIINIIEEIFYNLLIASIISIIIFAIYVELSPKMTNIWYRINANGDKTIQIKNLFELMMGPLKYDFYWYPQYYDINFFIYLITIFIMLELYSNSNKIII
jgi:hypothetical protein